MKNTTLFILFYAICYSTQAQHQVKKNFIYKSVAYDVFIIKADSALRNSFTITDNTGNQSEEDYFKTQGAVGDFFAITACVVDSACKPMGLYIANGQQINGINNNTGAGNFYLLPNGVLAYDGARFLLTESGVFSNSNTQWAIQSGPLLASSGNINTNFTKGSKNKFIRCGVGIYTDKGNEYLVFVKSNSVVNFYDFASLFIEKFNCKMALNLENMSNCSLHLPNQKDAGRSSVSICHYIQIKL